MTKQTSSASSSLLGRIAVSLVLLAGAIWILAAHWPVVSKSLHIARTAQLGWIGVSIGAMAATFCIAAAMYGVLALHHLRYRQTVLVEYAAAFVNRLLPSGLGGLGLHGVYLYKRKHTVAQATAVVSVNNLIGISGHLVLLLGVALLSPAAFRRLISGMHIPGGWGFLVGLVFVGISTVAMWMLRRRVAGFIKNLLISLKALHTQKVTNALGLAMLLTATYTAILYCVARSLDLPITVLQAFIIFSLGMLASTATPTPGGLIGAEAGLFAGFVAYGATDVSAGAAVLLYRLITYWLPLPIGLFALLMARRRRVI